jgi:hypothetical protein
MVDSRGLVKGNLVMSTLPSYFWFRFLLTPVSYLLLFKTARRAGKDLVLDI